MKATEHRNRQIKLAKDMMNDPIKSLLHNQTAHMKRVNGFMSKQELRDRVNNLELLLKLSQQDCADVKSKAKRAKSAAYALLATLVGIVVTEFGVLPW